MPPVEVASQGREFFPIASDLHRVGRKVIQACDPDTGARLAALDQDIGKDVKLRQKSVVLHLQNREATLNGIDRCRATAW